MKNISSLKANKTESPKTPGGISKNLLTPCRRVGLSRNWRKSGPSPFVSPLSGSGEPKEESPVIKRKRDEVDAEISKSGNSIINTTPSRNIHLPRRKKSKILPVDPEPSSPLTPESKTCELEEESSENTIVHNEITQNEEEPEVITPILKSKSKNSLQNFSDEALIDEDASNVTPVSKSRSKIKKFNPPLASNNKNNELLLKTEQKQSEKVENTVHTEESSVKTSPDKVVKLKSKKNSIKVEKSKKKSPDNLTKECIVVIQKKIFKKTASDLDQNDQSIVEPKPTSQVLFDSDSDDVPLCQLNKKDIEVIEVMEKPSSPIKKNAHNVQIQPRVLTLDEDDDFIETNKVKVHKLADKTTSTTSLKKMVKNKPKENKKPVQIMKETQPSSQSSDDDDFDFNNKRTILIRKSYDKVTKPLKAKSTGSITQRDIDELRSRIEIKKKVLLAKAMTQDTEELRELIKKWQKGCQDALSELMDLMRSKFPDKQNMEFSDMLQMLKIPTNLVGYDEENDCFNTPDDASIVLAQFRDI